MKVYDGTRADEGAEPASERLKIGIAEHEVTTDGAELATSGLGSCIGVALVDTATGAAGLVHVMLPTAEEMDDDNAAKFADTGTELLIEKLERQGADAADLEAKIAGGSEMLDFSESGPSVGVRNAEQVRETLAEHGIPITGEDIGGDHGRSLCLDATTGELEVKCANETDKRL